MPTEDPDPARRQRRHSDEHGRARTWVLVAVVVVVGLGTGMLVRLGAGPFPDPDGCTAEVGDETVRLTPTQGRHAGLIAAIAVERGLPARAVSIALATAFQESKLRNLAGGDRDSVGLFQQRPSQGWGSVEQIRDPRYATNAFYDALVEIEGYQSMRITEAAQAVQRSGFPEAYEEHADGARALASALTGYSPGAFWCVVDDADVAEEFAGASGLTARAERVRADLEATFGDLSLGGFAPGGVSSGHMEGSAHYDGRAIDVFVRPINPANKRRGWAIASYLVSQAERLAVDHVIFDGRIWAAGGRSDDGWRDYEPNVPSSATPGTRKILEHRDHVHLDVAR
jgi:hypothetical protein